MKHTRAAHPDDAPDLDEDRAETCARCESREARRNARADERQEALVELSATGMAISGALRRELEVVEATPPADRAGLATISDLSLAFNRVARAVRQTLALEARLEDAAILREQAANDHQSYDEVEAAAARVRAKVFDLSRLGDENDRRRALERGEGGDEADDDDREDLFDRPETDGRPGDSRAPAEVIAQVCRDLGVERDLGIWAEDDEAPASDQPPPDSAMDPRLHGDERIAGGGDGHTEPKPPAPARDPTGPP